MNKSGQAGLSGSVDSRHEQDSYVWLLVCLYKTKI